MKNRMLLLTLFFLFGSLAGCSIALSPALYGPPYYTGPAYLYSPPVMIAPPPIVIAPAPVVMGPIVIAPWWPYYYGYGGGYGYGYPYYHRHYRRR